MNPFILALATAVPQFSQDQSALAQKVIDYFQMPQEINEQIVKLYDRSGIKRRYSVLPDIERSIEESTFFGPEFPSVVPSSQDRNEVYKEEAPRLACQAVERLLNSYERDAREITHIISVSCTGVMAPGIEYIIQHTFGLNPSVQRYGVNFMGCFGALKGLALARALALQDPAHRILVVCTELCSLHVQVGIDPDVLIGNALFSDGAAAVLVGCDPRVNEEPLWSIEKCASTLIPDSEDKMTWSIGEAGFVMSLSREVPAYIKSSVPGFMDSFIEALPVSHWAIHPGGKKIIEAVEQSCGLSHEQTQASWNVLRDYGNMSSPTFLFVLDQLRSERDGYTVGMSFGPGLSCEALLLKGADTSNQ